MTPMLAAPAGAVGAGVAGTDAGIRSHPPAAPEAAANAAASVGSIQSQPDRP